MDTCNFDFDLDLFIKSFSDAGASITKGNGRLYVDGKETDVVSALKLGFKDAESFKSKTDNVTVKYNANKQMNTNWVTPEQMLAA